jgi:hypothetical protein
MAVNLIVAAVTLFLAVFGLIWLSRPDLRRWFEAPKYRVMSWDARPMVNDHRPDTTRIQSSPNESKAPPP